jgi:hypothetical protein
MPCSILDEWRSLRLSYPDSSEWQRSRRRAHFASWVRGRLCPVRVVRRASAEPKSGLPLRFAGFGRALAVAISGGDSDDLVSALEAVRGFSSSIASRVWSNLCARDRALDVVRCDHCNGFGTEELDAVAGGDSVCQSCMDDSYCCCSDCNETVENDDVTDIGGDSVCQSCRDNGDYFCCGDCSEWRGSDDSQYELSSGRCVCSGCSESYYYWESDGMYHDSEEDDETVAYPDQGDSQRDAAIYKWLTSRAAAGIVDCELPNSALSDQGLSALFEAMRGRGLLSWDYQESATGKLSSDGKAVRCGLFDTWARAEGYGSDGIPWSTKAGTLPKRVAKFFASCGIKLRPDSLGMIGDLARSYCPKSHKYRYDVVCNGGFDWKSGEFGDHGSCYWGCHAKCRHQLQSQHNAFAIRFYDTSSGSGNPRGVGRAWCVVQDGIAFLFNYYGPDSLLTAARMLAVECAGLYHEIRLSCNGGTGDFYLNNSGSGYSVGYRSDADFPSEHDFSFRGF